MGYAAILILVSLSILLAYLGWRAWPITNTVLAVLILWTSMGFFYLAARALKTHQYWGAQANQLEAELNRFTDENRKLASGDPVNKTPGVHQLSIRLTELTTDRGRIWYGATVDKVDGDTGGATVTVPAPTPHNIVDKMVLFAFQSKPFETGGRYVGEFHVTSVKDKALTLTPAQTLSAAEKQAIGEGPWDLYSSMPLDDPAVFAGMTAAEKAKLPPPSDPNATWDNPKRELTDYALRFQQLHAERVAVAEAIKRVEHNIARTAIAIEETNRDIAARTGEQGNLQGDLDKFRRDLKVITDYQKTLTDQLAALRKQLGKVYAETNQLAAELKVLQLKAAEEINRRTDAAVAER